MPDSERFGCKICLGHVSLLPLNRLWATGAGGGGSGWRWGHLRQMVEVQRQEAAPARVLGGPQRAGARALKNLKINKFEENRL